MSRVSILTALSLSLLVAPPIGAQQLGNEPFRSWSANPGTAHGMLHPVGSMSDGITSKRSHWVLGGIIGAVAVGGLTAAETSNGMCQDSGAGCTVFTGVIGAAVGFVVGALIGGQF